MVFCSICGSGIPTAFNCNVLGNTHLRIGLNAYLLNDSYVAKKNEYSNEEAFQVFCPKCYGLGYYHKKIIDKYPEILQKYSQMHVKKLDAEWKKINQEQKVRINYLTNQISQLKQDLENSPTNFIYKRFQMLYETDQKKMSSLQSFKEFQKYMSSTSHQFKQKFQKLCINIEKQYINSSIKKIQVFFLSYSELIQKKISSFMIDINRLEKLKEETIFKCSESNSMMNNQLMQLARIKTITSAFDSEIKAYELSITKLEQYKKIGIVELKDEQFQMFKLSRTFDLSDAELHKKEVVEAFNFDEVE